MTRIHDVTLVADLSPETPPDPQAVLELDNDFYLGDENTLIGFKINRTIRTDQTVSIDWAITNVSVTPLTGTETFNPGDTQKTPSVLGLEIDTTEIGEIVISNPLLISGPSGDPILGAQTTAVFQLQDLDNPDFESDSHIWADTAVELGTVPNDYANYSLLRVLASHINLHEDCEFTLSAGTHTIIVGLPNPNSHVNDQPNFMSSWLYTGKTGTIKKVPNRDGVEQDVTVYYYSKSVSGTFTWRNTASVIQKQLHFYTPFFLFPPGVNLSGIYPELYEVIPNISNAYIVPLIDGILWSPTPDDHPPVTDVASSWGNMVTLANNANDGDVIQAPGGTLNDDGTNVYNNLQFDPRNPLWLVAAPTTLLRGATRSDFNNCRGIRYYGFEDDDGMDLLATQSDYKMDLDSDCRYISIENNWWNECVTSLAISVLTFVKWRGKYNRFSGNKILRKDSRGNAVNMITSGGANGSDTQFNIFTHNDCDGMNTNAHDSLGENNAFLRNGTSIVHDDRAHTLIGWNRFADWHKVPNDSEFLVLKSCGPILIQNVHDSNVQNHSSTGFQVRQGSWALAMGNTVIGKSNNSPVSGVYMVGSNDITGLSQEFLDTNHIYARHYVEEFDGPNGFMQFDQQSSTNRFAAHKCLLVEINGFDNTDQMIRMLARTGSTEPTEIYLYAICMSSSQTMCLESYDSSGALIWLSSIIDGSSHGFDVSGLPAECAEVDPNWFQNANGIMVSDHAQLILPFEACIPFAQQGDNLADLGTTYPSN